MVGLDCGRKPRSSWFEGAAGVGICPTIANSRQLPAARRCHSEACIFNFDIEEVLTPQAAIRSLNLTF